LLGCHSHDSERVLKRERIDPNDLFVVIFYVGAKHSKRFSLACSAVGGPKGSGSGYVI